MNQLATAMTGIHGAFRNRVTVGLALLPVVEARGTGTGIVGFSGIAWVEGGSGRRRREAGQVHPDLNRCR